MQYAIQKFNYRIILHSQSTRVLFKQVECRYLGSPITRTLYILLKSTREQNLLLLLSILYTVFQ